MLPQAQKLKSEPRDFVRLETDEMCGTVSPQYSHMTIPHAWLLVQRKGFGKVISPRDLVLSRKVVNVAMFFGLALSIVLSLGKAAAQTAPEFSPLCPPDVRTLPAARLWPELCGKNVPAPTISGNSGNLALLSRRQWKLTLEQIDEADLKISRNIRLYLRAIPVENSQTMC